MIFHIIKHAGVPELVKGAGLKSPSAFFLLVKEKGRLPKNKTFDQTFW